MPTGHGGIPLFGIWNVNPVMINSEGGMSTVHAQFHACVGHSGGHMDDDKTWFLCARSPRPCLTQRAKSALFKEPPSSVFG
jgi:hypothetical protein